MLYGSLVIVADCELVEPRAWRERNLEGSSDVEYGFSSCWGLIWMSGLSLWIVDVMTEANFVVVCWELNHHCACLGLMV